jgi:hypothetical protein
MKESGPDSAPQLEASRQCVLYYGGQTVEHHSVYNTVEIGLKCWMTWEQSSRGMERVL